MATRAWMVRTAMYEDNTDDCVREGVVSIGWPLLGDLSDCGTRDELRERLWAEYGEDDGGFVRASLGQLWRFLREIQPDDWVITQTWAKDAYHFGRITGGYEYRTQLHPDMRHVRAVEWRARVPRGEVSESLRKALGLRPTVFEVRGHNDEIERLVAVFGNGRKRVGPVPAPPPPDALKRILELAKKAQSRARRRGGFSEAETVEELVKPILEILGWSEERGEIVEQYSVPPRRRVDLALILGGRSPVALVECKQLGEDLPDCGHAVDQVLMYCQALDPPVPWAILTTGLQWAVYDALRTDVATKGKCILFVDLTRGDDEAEPEALLRLSHGSVQGGGLVDLAKEVGCFHAVGAVLSEPPEELIRAVADRAAGAGVVLPDDEQLIRETLRDCAEWWLNS